MPFPNNSVIVPRDGGTGNQMFIYAAGYSLAKKTNSKLFVLIDEKDMQNNPYNSQRRNFVFHKLNIPQESVIYQSKLNKLFTKLYIKLKLKGAQRNKELDILRDLLKIVFNVKLVDDQNFFDVVKQKNNQVLLMNDYLESYLYFEDYKDDLIKLFTPSDLNIKNLENIVSQVSNKTSICVHVRRTDKIDSKHYLPIDYQKQAINLAKESISNPTFFIFSDDIDMTKKELGNITNSIYVSGHSSIEDFYILNNCHNIIVANSSFSWWAAYLNKQKDRLVIAPYPKYSPEFFLEAYDDGIRRQKQKLSQIGYCPKEWILLDYQKNQITFNSKEKEN
ncbi:MAG: alpha-1,2-fucosyltransferase [Pseudomonadota bacterium]